LSLDNGDTSSLVGVCPYDGMKPTSKQYDNFTKIPDSLLMLTPAITTYFAYNHIYAVKNIDDNKKFTVTIKAKLSHNGLPELIEKTIIFKRTKKLRLVRLVC
jgi:hypothetical protein